MELLLLGNLNLKSLNEFSSQIIKKPFYGWHELPVIMSNKDINIAQIENIFINATKSENIVNFIILFPWGFAGMG